MNGICNSFVRSLILLHLYVSLSHEMLRTDFHGGHRGLARGEMLSPSRLFLVPSFPISSILPEGAALPSVVAVLERRYGGKVLLNSHNVQPLFQICKKTAQRVTVESVREENNTERRTLAFLSPCDDDDGGGEQTRSPPRPRRLAGRRRRRRRPPRLLPHCRRRPRRRT